MQYRILLVEDDAQIREAVEDYFTGREEDEVQMICAKDGIEGMGAAMEAGFDLAILDIMLPGMDGFALCRELRRASVVPIIFLTARGSEEDKLRGYLMGADDYMVKPFSLAVLYAKVKALIKREKGMVGSPVLQVGDILLDPARYSVTVDGKLVDITPKEYALLRYLMEHKGRVSDREELLAAIWGYDFEGTDRVVDNHIKKLRKLLGRCGTQIKTVRRAGYKIEEK